MQQNSKISLQDQLGDGLTSTVSRCKIGEEIYAIKVFKDSCSLKSRIREIQALTVLQDCSVVQMVANDPAYSWIVFPLLYQKDLFDFIALEKKAFPENIAKTLFGKIASTVNKMHSKGYAHRDLKLENILIDPKSLEVIISDLGFAEPIYSHTHVARSMGTSGYMAPELQGHSIDGRPLLERIESTGLPAADIFALGVCLFIVTFAHPPFTSTKKADNCAYWRCIYAGKWETFWKACERHKPARSRQLKNLLEWMLNANPKKRPTIEQIIESQWMIEAIGTQEHYFMEMSLRKSGFGI